MFKDTDPFGQTIYWYGKIGQELDAGEGTDFNAINQGYCSVSPLSVYMTVHKHKSNMQEWLNSTDD
jgi:5'-nucleotidase